MREASTYGSPLVLSVEPRTLSTRVASSGVSQVAGMRGRDDDDAGGCESIADVDDGTPAAAAEGFTGTIDAGPSARDEKRVPPLERCDKGIIDSIEAVDSIPAPDGAIWRLLWWPSRVRSRDVSACLCLCSYVAAASIASTLREFKPAAAALPPPPPPAEP
jgi:hypothetical protein